MNFLTKLFSKRETLIKRIHIFLKTRIVKNPKNRKQIQRDWLFSFTNGTISLFGDQRKLLGDMNLLAKITVTSQDQVLIQYTSGLKTEDLEMLLSVLKSWGPSLYVRTKQLITVNIEKLLQ